MKYLLFTVTLNLLFFTNIVSSTVLISANYDNETTNTKKYNINGNLHLQCNVTSAEPIEVRWEKNKSPLDLKELKDRAKISEDTSKSLYTLSIKHASELDAGNYSCVAYKKGEDVELGRTNIVAGSSLRVKVADSINVVEGERLRIHCLIQGNPPPTISWDAVNETDIKESGNRIVLQEDPEKKIPNAIFIIENVDMGDRGEYKCIGYSEVTQQKVESTCMVRIKDKYAALWPFLGICAEVFVLCAIIFIYEKKRNKTELEESDTDQSPDQKNTPDHGKESNLRHRQ